MTTMTQAAPTVQALNKQIANFGVLYVKLHHYHWFVKGPHFFTLHAKFEQLYNEVTGHFDAVAERVLALRGTPVSTMRQFLELSAVSEAAGGESDKQMVQQVVRDFDTIVEEMKEGIVTADHAADPATADLLTGIVRSLEKHRWMLVTFAS